MAKENPTNPHVHSFINHLRAERGLAANTVDAYRSDLQQISEYFSKDKITDNLINVDQSSLEELILKLKNSSYSDTSIARKLASLKSLFRFLHEEGAATIVHVVCACDIYGNFSDISTIS